MKVWRVWLTLLLSSSLISCVRGCVMPGMVCVSCVRVWSVCAFCSVEAGIDIGNCYRVPHTAPHRVALHTVRILILGVPYQYTK